MSVFGLGHTDEAPEGLAIVSASRSASRAPPPQRTPLRTGSYTLSTLSCICIPRDGSQEVEIQREAAGAETTQSEAGHLPFARGA